jgi:hypothetical protein
MMQTAKIINKLGHEVTPEQAAFEAFAAQYPHEAHERDPKRFCDYVRSVTGNDLTNEEIEDLLA